MYSLNSLVHIFTERSLVLWSAEWAGAGWDRDVVGTVAWGSSRVQWRCDGGWVSRVKLMVGCIFFHAWDCSLYLTVLFCVCLLSLWCDALDLVVGFGLNFVAQGRCHLTAHWLYFSGFWFVALVWLEIFYLRLCCFEDVLLLQTYLVVILLLTFCASVALCALP